MADMNYSLNFVKKVAWGLGFRVIMWGPFWRYIGVT